MRNSGIDWITPLALALMLASLAAAAGCASPALQRVMTEALIYVVMVVGLYVFSGNSGVTSFGHASFMIVSAYVSALLTLPLTKKHALLELSPLLEHAHMANIPAAVLAAGCSAVMALVVGWPLMRLRGVVPSMATFALLIITHVVAQNWKGITGGRQALVGLPLDTTLWSALVWSIIAIVIATLYQQTRQGALLRCTREDEVAAESIGVNLARERMVAFVISAFLSGLGGVLFAHFLGTLSPNTFYLDTTFLTLAMWVVGGFRSLSGAVVGVLILKGVAESFRVWEDGVTLWGSQFTARPGVQEVALALILLAILMFRPDGIFGNTEFGALVRRRAYSAESTSKT